MITAKRILRVMRMQLQDNNEIIYSDYQILNAINRALRYISQASKIKDADFMEARQEYIVPENNSYAESGVNLPDDFLLLTDVIDSDAYTLQPCEITKTPQSFQYKIIGEKIYTGSNHFFVYYKHFVLSLTDVETDVINMPAYCEDLIIQTAMLVLSDADMQTILNTMNGIIDIAIPVRTYDRKKLADGGK